MKIEKKNLKTKRQLDAFEQLTNYSMNKEEEDRCVFILKYFDKYVAARYLTYDWGFLFVQAIMDNFDLPIAFPNEDEKPACNFRTAMERLLKEDEALTFEVWHWCLKAFVYFQNYSCFGVHDLYEIYGFEEENYSSLVDYMNEHRDFLALYTKIETDGYDYFYYNLIIHSLKKGYFDVAQQLFDSCMDAIHNDYNDLEELLRVYSYFDDYNEENIQLMEYFRDNLVQRAKKYSISWIDDLADSTSKEIDEEIEEIKIELADINDEDDEYDDEDDEIDEYDDLEEIEEVHECDGKYISKYDELLYCNIIKANFPLPCALPTEEDCREMEFYEILAKLYKRDKDVMFNVWRWCMSQIPIDFVDNYSFDEMSSDVIYYSKSFGNDFLDDVEKYMKENPDFAALYVSKKNECKHYEADFVASVLENNNFELGKLLFFGITDGVKWSNVNDFCKRISKEIYSNENLELLEQFRDDCLFVLREQTDDDMIREHIDDLEYDIAEYIEDVENNSYKYRFKRRNQWRKEVPFLTEFDLDLEDYTSKEDYLKDFEAAVKAWKDEFLEENDNTYGLNLDDYIDPDKFYYDLQIAAQKEEKRKKLEALDNKRKKIESQESCWYLGVVFNGSNKVYNYLAEDGDFKLGDSVIVPVGEYQIESYANVVSVGLYSKEHTPIPLNISKPIISKIEQ